jgi:hypothetical protein
MSVTLLRARILPSVPVVRHTPVVFRSFPSSPCKFSPGSRATRKLFRAMLRSTGADIKLQQELLRHANIQTTMNIYTQAVSDQKRAANSKVGEMVLSGAKIAPKQQTSANGSRLRFFATAANSFK